MIDQRAVASELLWAWTCPDCDEWVASRSETWVEHARSTHVCPNPARLNIATTITKALQGLYDG